MEQEKVHDNFDKMVRNTQIYRRQNNNKLIGAHRIAFFSLAILLVMIFSMDLTSAFEFDNVKNFKKEGKYGKVEIRNSILGIPFLQLGKVAEYELTYNTDSCLVDCHAEGTATLYEEGRIFQKMKFVNKQGKNKNIDYTIYIKTDGEWIEYNGAKVVAGEYEWRIEGKKSANENVDWIGTAFGIDLTDWAWWDTGWEKRREVTILGGITQLDNFTVLINVTFDSDMAIDFIDLRFIDGACSGVQNVELDYEFDVVSDSNYALIWVKIPELAVGTDTICMYYKNTAATNGEDIPNAWDDNYKLIYHFTEGTGTNVFDSSFSEGNGTIATGGGVLWNTTAGRIGNAYNFNKSMLINVTTASGINFTDAPFTMETFIISPSSDGFRPIVAGDGSNNMWGAALSTTSTVLLGKQAVDQSTSTDTITVNVSDYISIVYESDDNVNFTINRTADSGNTHSYSTTFTAKSNMHIGRDAGSTFIGRLDELRISNISRSLDWQIRSRDNVLMNNSFSGEEDVGLSVGVVLSFPADGSSFATAVLNFTANLTASGGNLTNATLFIWNPDNSLFGTNFTEVTGLTNTTTLTFDNFVLGTGYQYNFFACVNDTSPNTLCNFTTANFSFNIGINKDSETFALSTLETQDEMFEVNISIPAGIVAVEGTFNYNGTPHRADVTCDISACSLSTTIDIPLVTEGENQSKNFFWQINSFSSTTVIQTNTTLAEQNVSRIHFELCNATFVNNTANFTAWDEQNIYRVNPFDFGGTFEIWLGGGTVKRNNSISQTQVAEVATCILPGNETFRIDSTIEYNENLNGSIYSTRNYYFQNDTVSSSIKDINLFLLVAADATSFILKVQNNALIPLANVLIYTQRFYPGENVFRTVQVSKTDSNGQTVGFFETETIDYRFRITQQATTLLQTIVQKMIPETAPFTLLFTVGQDEGNPWETTQNLSDFNFELNFNKDTKVVTYTYEDTSGNLQLSRLLVTEHNRSGLNERVICDFNSSQASSTIVCNVGNSTTSYIATALITRSGSRLIVDIITFVVESFSSIVGLYGVFLAWFIILISGFAFKFNEIAGIAMINVAVIFVNLIGLVTFGAFAVTSIIAVSLLIIVMMNK